MRALTPVPPWRRGDRRALVGAPLARARASAARTRPVVGRLLLAWDRWTDAGRGTSWSAVADRLGSVRPSAISVDVFDTVLSRRVAREEHLWWLVATALRDQGRWSGSPAEFVAARRAAARAAPLADLRGIYEHEVLAARCAPALGAEVERQMELDLSVDVPGAVAALQRLRSSGHRISFLSDMHLPPSAVRELLASNGVARPGEDVVVSSAVGASKSGGAVFTYLRDRSSLPEWHIGNDLWSDVAMPERAGIPAVATRVAELSALEGLMARGPASTASVIAAAARHVRCSAIERPADEAALIEVGADVAGQALVAFLLWVQEQCTELGVRDLCFMARDGELPLQMARAMPADHWSGVSLRYLQGNRRLWSMAAASVVGVDAWLSAGTAGDTAHLRHAQHDIPLQSLLGRVGLTPADLDGHSPLLAAPLDEPLPRALETAWGELLQSPQVRRRISTRADRQFRYLEEMLKAQSPLREVACVDVGWTGQMAAQVSVVLGEITGHEPVHLHFGGVGVDVGGVDVGDVDTHIRRFAFDDSVAELPFRDVVSCVETFTASGGERAVALKRDDRGSVQFVTEAALPQMDTPARRLLRQSAVDVAGAVPPLADLQRWQLPSAGTAEAVRDVLTAFWLRPTRRQAWALSLLTAEVDDDGIGVHRVASPYRLADLKASKTPSDRTWRQGSLRLTPLPLRAAFWTALTARPVLTRWARTARSS